MPQNRRPTLFLCALTALLGIVTTLPSHAAPPIDLHNTIMLPAVGLKLPMPRDALSQPIPPPEAHTYILSRGNERWTEDRFQALELWYATQHVAEWALPSRGTRLILGAATLAPPSGFTDTDITRDQFALYTNSPMAQLSLSDDASLRSWLASFTGCPKLGSPQALPAGRTRLSHLYRFPTGRPDMAAWLFRFNRSAGGLAHLPDLWIALTLVLDSKTPLQPEIEYVEKGILANLSPLGRFEGRESISERLQRERASKGVRPHPTRDAAHASIASHPDWWYLDSEDYVLLCNSSLSRDFARSLLDDLQQARSLYAKRLPGTADTANDVAIIRIFATEAEYRAYVDPDYAWTGGLYDGNRRELILRPIPAKSNNAAYHHILQVALHEGFHQYLHQALGATATPSVWFNEGFAAFYEELSFRNNRPEFDESKERFSILETYLKTKPPQPIPIPQLLAMDYQAFYAGSNRDRAFKYSLAWAFIYFLERGAPLVRNQPYANILPSYIQALQQSTPGDIATQAAFQNINLDALERDFRDFWSTPRSRSLAKRR